MLINFRKDLIKDFLHAGHRVYVVNTDGSSEESITQLGARVLNLRLKSNQIRPLSDLSFYFSLKRALKLLKPDIVMNYNLKPILIGTYAARKAGINEVYSTVTGLGYFFIDSARRKRLSARLLSWVMNSALMKNDKVFFQNRDDVSDLVKKECIKKKSVVINGSGVNMGEFPFTQIPKKFSFIMISRLLKDKGVLEYFRACDIVRKKYPNVLCKFVGGFDSNPSSLDMEEVSSYFEKGIVQYLGEQSEVYPYLRSSSVLVLPSYREGVPRVCLEAMSTGRPLITTDVPGCRETVDHGKNGFLVPPRDATSLAERMIWMIENADALEYMGKESRRICEEKFDVRKVNMKIIEVLNLDHSSHKGSG